MRRLYEINREINHISKQLTVAKIKGTILHLSAFLFLAMTGMPLNEGNSFAFAATVSIIFLMLFVLVIPMCRNNQITVKALSTSLDIIKQEKADRNM